MRSFEELSDFDFELVVADLLAAEWLKPVMTFPMGRDGGIDLLSSPSGAKSSNAPGTVAVQCKHSPGKNYKDLRSSLVKEKAKAIHKRVSRYVIATSASLKRKNKEDIITMFDDVLNLEDIVGRSDLSDMLRRHPKVEEAHFKLWITNSGVLRRMVANAEHMRSERFREGLLRRSQIFVDTGARHRAMEALSQDGICVLTGPPGVGKTATAEMILLRLLGDGWEPITAIGNVKELETQWQAGVRQALFFDDFLGQTSMREKLDRNEDAALISLMEDVSRDAQKCLILTSRNYILADAFRAHPRLNDPVVHDSVIRVDIGQLSQEQRAHILYNILYFSPLREATRVDPGAPIALRALVRHPNFNPRIIEQTVKSLSRQIRRPIRRFSSPSQDVDSEDTSTLAYDSIDVPAALQASLNSPVTLWKNVLDEQLTPTQRALLFARASLESESVVAVPMLIDAAQKIADIDELVTGHRSAWLGDLLVLEGDLLRTERSRTREVEVVHKLDPGLSDALIQYTSTNPDLYRTILSSAVFFEQLEWLIKVLDQALGRHRIGTIDVAVTGEILRVLCSTLDNDDPSTAFARATLYPERKTISFKDVGRRLRVIHEFSERFGLAPDDGVLAQALRIGRPSEQAMIASAGADILRELSRSGRRAWLRWKTELAFTLLSRVADERDGLETFQDLADLLEVVEAEKRWLHEMTTRLEAWVESEVSDIESDLGISVDTDDQDDISEMDLGDAEERLSELSELVERFRVTIYDLNEASSKVESIRDKREREDSPTRPISARPVETSSRQRPGDVFDRF